MGLWDRIKSAARSAVDAVKSVGGQVVSAVKSVVASPVTQAVLGMIPGAGPVMAIASKAMGALTKGAEALRGGIVGSVAALGAPIAGPASVPRPVEERLALPGMGEKFQTVPFVAPTAAAVAGAGVVNAGNSAIFVEYNRTTENMRKGK